MLFHFQADLCLGTSPNFCKQKANGEKNLKNSQKVIPLTVSHFTQEILHAPFCIIGDFHSGFFVMALQ